MISGHIMTHFLSGQQPAQLLQPCAFWLTYFPKNKKNLGSAISAVLEPLFRMGFLRTLQLLKGSLKSSTPFTYSIHHDMQVCACVKDLTGLSDPY